MDSLITLKHERYALEKHTNTLCMFNGTLFPLHDYIFHKGRL